MDGPPGRPVPKAPRGFRHPCRRPTCRRNSRPVIAGAHGRTKRTRCPWPPGPVIGERRPLSAPSRPPPSPKLTKKDVVSGARASSSATRAGPSSKGRPGWAALKGRGEIQFLHLPVHGLGDLAPPMFRHSCRKRPETASRDLAAMMVGVIGALGPASGGADWALEVLCFAVNGIHWFSSVFPAYCNYRLLPPGLRRFLRADCRGKAAHRHKSIFRQGPPMRGGDGRLGVQPLSRSAVVDEEGGRNRTGPLSLSSPRSGGPPPRARLTRMWFSTLAGHDLEDPRPCP